MWSSGDPSGTEFGASDSVSGFTDLYPVASLAWNNGVHNGMIYVTGDIPVGDYDNTRLANLGIGHAAIDSGGGYTYFNQKTGWEFSVVAGFTYNWAASTPTSIGPRRGSCPRAGSWVSRVTVITN